MKVDLKPSLEKTLKRIVYIGSFLVILVPLIVIPKSYFPYIIQKTLILRILIEAVFFSWLVLAFAKKEYRPQRTVIFWSVMAFFVVMVITGITSQSPVRSWLGNWERMFGVFTLLHYLGWFVALTSVFKEVKDWNKILNFTLLVSLFISIYSLIQRFDLGLTLQSGLERVNGTLGNASYLAAYLLFHIFIALLFLVEKSGWKWKLYYLFVLLLNFIILMLTATRGAQLALFVSFFVVVVFIFYLKAHKQKLSKIFLGVCLAFIVLGSLLFVFRNSNFIQNNYWTRRLTSYSITDNTIQTRLHSWRWGIKGFRDNLLLGVGPENYHIPFNQYFEPTFYDYTGSEVWFDRAHNIFIDMAATMGIFGLLTYLGMFGSAFYILFKAQKGGLIRDLPFIILFLAFFSHFLQNGVVFDSLNTLIIFYLLLGYLSFVASLGENDKKEAEAIERSKGLPVSLTLPASAVLFLVLLFININDIRTNNLVLQAYAKGIFGEYQASVDKYREVYKISYNKFDLPILFSTSLNSLINSSASSQISQERKIEDLKTAVDWTDKAIEIEPKNMFYYHIQSKNLALLAALSGEVRYLEKGIKMAEKAHELSPKRVRPYWMLAQLYQLGGQPERALSYLKKAEELNSNLYDTYVFMVSIYKSLGDEEKVIQQYDRLVDLDYNFNSDQNTVRSLIDHYQFKDDQRRVEVLENILKRITPEIE